METRSQAVEVASSLRWQKPRRLVLVVSSLQAGGMERVASILAEAWDRQGIEITLLTAYPAGTDFHVVPNHIRRIVLGFADETMGYLRRLVSHFRSVVRLRRAIRAVGPDVLLSFGHTTNLLTILAGTGLRIPVVVSERTDPRMAPSSRVTWYLRPSLYRRASQVVVQSHSVRRWFEKKLAPDTVRVIPNPVTLPRLGNARRKEKRVIGMGRLVDAKGFDLLIRAFARCASEHRDWKLAIFGEGPERLALERLSQELGVTCQVEFGGLTREPIQELAASEIFVLASRFEGFPNTLVEAMSCGVAVVSFDCPSGPSEIIRDGADGILVPDGDVEQLSKSLSRLMADAGLRTRLGSDARTVLERYGVEKVSGMWHELFAELIANRD